MVALDKKKISEGLKCCRFRSRGYWKAENYTKSRKFERFKPTRLYVKPVFHNKFVPSIQIFFCKCYSAILLFCNVCYPLSKVSNLSINVFVLYVCKITNLATGERRGLSVSSTISCTHLGTTFLYSVISSCIVTLCRGRYNDATIKCWKKFHKVEQ